jgi:2-polyprenyl-3-methyl-5-hydroxy-6-metoxy-1,4-benzoquinol methylase
MPDNPDTGYYFNTRKEVLEHMPVGVKTLLDIGCGAGVFAGEVKKRQNITVWGVELNENIAAQSGKNIDHLIVGDISAVACKLPDNYFDCITCNDILEHIYDPYEILRALKSKLTKSGILICSIPNVRFIRILKSVLFKKEWEYTESGIMDFTHIRFFTKASIIRMFDKLDYQVLDIIGINKRKMSLGFCVLNFIFAGLLEDTVFPQFLCKAAPKQA